MYTIRLLFRKILKNIKVFTHITKCAILTILKKEETFMNKENRGLYDQSFEHDNCGIGAVVNIKG